MHSDDFNNIRYEDRRHKNKTRRTSTHGKGEDELTLPSES